MPQTPSQTDTYNTALDIFDKTHPLRVDVDENLKVTLDSQVVEVVGTVAIDQTGNNNVVRELNTDKNYGTWTYYAGVAGTVIVTAGQRVVGISAYSTTGGLMTINGGPAITFPPGVALSIEPNANLVAPTIVFTNTSTYMIEVVS